MSGSLYGGVPEGRLVQLAGPSQTAKSFFIQKIVANAQKMGYIVVIVDSENAIDEESAIGFGIDPSKVKYIPALTIENTRNTLFKFLKGVKDKGLDGRFLIVVDSLGNMESELGEARMEKDSVSQDMGTLARSTKSLLRTLTNWCRLTRTPCVVTNHVYDDPSAMYPSLEKNMSGGKGAIYLPSITLQLARKAAKDDDGKTIDKDLAASQKTFSGVIIRSLSVKNRFTKQYVEVEMYLSFATGLDRYYGLKEIMTGMGVITLNGSTYSDWEGNKLGFYKTWRKDKALWEDRLLPELEKKIKENWCYGNKVGEEAPNAPEDEEALEEDVLEYDDVPDED
jgi:RecA/RadA recombinase